MASLQQEFTDEIEAYLAESGLTPTVFGRMVLKDPSFVFRLRKGRSCGAKTIDRVRAYISDQRQEMAAASEAS